MKKIKNIIVGTIIGYCGFIKCPTFQEYLNQHRLSSENLRMANMEQIARLLTIYFSNPENRGIDGITNGKALDPNMEILQENFLVVSDCATYDDRTEGREAGKPIYEDGNFLYCLRYLRLLSKQHAQYVDGKDCLPGFEIVKPEGNVLTIPLAKNFDIDKPATFIDDINKLDPKPQKNDGIILNLLSQYYESAKIQDSCGFMCINEEYQGIKLSTEGRDLIDLARLLYKIISKIRNPRRLITLGSWFDKTYISFAEKGEEKPRILQLTDFLKKNALKPIDAYKSFDLIMLQPNSSEMQDTIDVLKAKEQYEIRIDKLRIQIDSVEELKPALIQAISYGINPKTAIRFSESVIRDFQHVVIETEVKGIGVTRGNLTAFFNDLMLHQKRYQSVKVFFGKGMHTIIANGRFV